MSSFMFTVHVHAHVAYIHTLNQLNHSRSPKIALHLPTTVVMNDCYAVSYVKFMIKSVQGQKQPFITHSETDKRRQLYILMYPTGVGNDKSKCSYTMLQHGQFPHQCTVIMYSMYTPKVCNCVLFFHHSFFVFMLKRPSTSYSTYHRILF